MIFEDEAIWSEDIFKTTCESVAKDWSIFNKPGGQYKDSSTLRRKSNLSKTLSEIDSIENALSEQLSSVVMIFTKSSLGISDLFKNLTDKKYPILNVAKTYYNSKTKWLQKKVWIL